MKTPRIAGIVAALLLLGPLGAQQAGEQPIPNDPVQQAFAEWQAQYDATWRLTMRPETGTAQMLWGSRREALFTPTTQAEWEELARMNFADAHSMLAVADSTLRLATVKDLGLSRIGSSDKVAVVFDQEHRGVPVVNSSASAIFDAQGGMLALYTSGLPGVETLSTTPLLGSYAAIKAAHDAYVQLEGREAIDIHEPALVIYPHQVGKTVAPRLAWAVELSTPGTKEMVVPSGRRVYVAADVQGTEVLGNDELVHHQVSGDARVWSTPGTLPDHGGNNETLEPLRWANVTSSQGNTTTDASGNFSIPGAASTNVTFSFDGTFATVNNDAGVDYSLTQFYNAGAPATATLNPTQAAAITAQANAYQRASDFHVYVRGVDPGDGSMDFQILCNANLASTCNAFYNGSSVNFYAAGGGCVNTAFSTVVAHEIGHWANDVYSTGNGSSGIGEGMADVWAMFQYDDPIVGEDFFGQGGGNIRTGLNNTVWCGTGCYGQVHLDGEVIMGALWKARRNLNNTLGNAAGDAVSDLLNLSWFQAYNQTVIAPIIEEQWLVLDDNDGNLGNGTPNFTDIDDAFREQGFPGVDLPTIDILHTPLGNTQNEAGPYTVSADVTSLIGANITSVELKYSVDGGSEQTVAMSNTGGDTYEGNIPGQVSPAEVIYYVEASDDQSNTKRLPDADGFGFFVGVFQQIYFNNFDGGSDDGWTHGGSGQDDWMRGTPNGSSTDPSAAWSPNNVWGNDLGPSGWNGAYQPNVNNWLQSPEIDCSGFTGVKVRFRRWLNVEDAVFDQANFEVEGATIWQNPNGSNFLESDWTHYTEDISVEADNNPSVTFRFEMNSDGGVQFGGWNIDDFEVFAVLPVGGPVVNTINLTGDTVQIPGGIVNYFWDSAPASSPYWFYASKTLNGATINGQPFDIGPNIKTVDTGMTSAIGTGSYTSAPLPNRFAGKTFYLEVRVDETGSGDTYDSNFLQLDVL